MSYWVVQGVCVVMFALGFGASTYAPAAIERGWGIGKMYRDYSSPMMTVALGGVLFSIGLTFWHLNWWSIGVTVVLGYALMVVLLKFLKTQFQILPPALFVLVPWALVFMKVD